MATTKTPAQHAADFRAEAARLEEQALRYRTVADVLDPREAAELARTASPGLSNDGRSLQEAWAADTAARIRTTTTDAQEALQ